MVTAAAATWESDITESADAEFEVKVNAIADMSWWAIPAGANIEEKRVWYIAWLASIATDSRISETVRPASNVQRVIAMMSDTAMPKKDGATPPAST